LPGIAVLERMGTKIAVSRLPDDLEEAAFSEIASHSVAGEN